MRPTLFQLQDILDVFQREKILTKEQLLQRTGCSSMTAWRLLCQQGYFTSYNENARYYTIVGIPQFDDRGLWAFRNARFSKWGSLTKTMVGLIQDSSTGLTAEQLQQLLEVKNLKPILTRLINRKSLARDRIGGRFVYFPLQQDTRAKQQKQRQKDNDDAQAGRSLPRLEHIIALLVEIIRRPENTPRQWARWLLQQGIHMGTGDIQAICVHYGIEKKGLLKS